MELEGQVEEFLYQNDNNNYTIAIFTTLGNETLTVVGYLPFVEIGDSLKLYGKMVVHQDYGEQFKIDSFEKVMPQTVESLGKYLASGTIKGIGPATAKRIVEKFGDQTLEVFQSDYKRLAEVKGITEERAIEIGEEFNEKWEVWQIVSFLEKFGIGANNAKKVYDALGKNAIEKIAENPYVLVEVAYGVDFAKIDKIALQIGISQNSDDRIKSGIKYALLVSSYNGHTCVIQENLLQYVEQILEVSQENIMNNLINLSMTEEIVIEKRQEIDWVYLYPFYKAEKNVCERLDLLNHCQNVKEIKEFEKEIKKQGKKMTIELSEKQFQAIAQVNENNVSIITGGPGTGKTTIIKCLIEIYKEHKKKIVLCAPTGRAAKRMYETTGEDAKTIHRLLEIGKIEDDKLKNIDHEMALIDADVLVVDEMSMVDIFLMNYIVKAVYLGTKLVFVGDVNQLPSVGPGNILRDLIESEKFATISLDKIFRQAAKSKIIVNSHNVNKGISFTEKKDYEENSLEDFFYINEVNTEKILYQVTSLSNGRLKNYGDYDFLQNIQILTPTKKGKLGTKELNKNLQNVLNPKMEEMNCKTYGEIEFREGDRVMQIKNNYDIYWEKRNLLTGLGTEHGSGIFNGELGILSKINNTDKNIEVQFDDGKTAWYAFSELDQLEHAYAITIHKAQRKRIRCCDFGCATGI